MIFLNRKHDVLTKGLSIEYFLFWRNVVFVLVVYTAPVLSPAGSLVS